MRLGRQTHDETEVARAGIGRHQVETSVSVEIDENQCGGFPRRRVVEIDSERGPEGPGSGIQENADGAGCGISDHDIVATVLIAVSYTHLTLPTIYSV